MSALGPVPILLVDDRLENLTALEALLGDLGLEQARALSGNEALRLSLKTEFALILLDVQMPGMDGFETAELLRANPKTRRVPIIFVTAGMKDDRHRFKGYEAGAVDYLMKPIEPLELRSKVRVFCELFMQRKEIERHEVRLESLVEQRTTALREAYQFNEQIIRSAQEGIIVHGPDLRYQVWNPFIEQLTGILARDVVGKHPLEVLPFLQDVGVTARLEKALAGEVAEPLTFPFQIPGTGNSGWATDNSAPLKNLAGETIGVIVTVSDITQHKQAEADKERLQAHLQQAQKMESLGSLAGGVAHDMNNVLAAILGLASAHVETQPTDSRIRKALQTIIKASERGGKMVQGLLSFARQSPAEQRELDMNAVLREEVQLLERTTLAKISLALDLAPDLRPTRGDAGALMNAFMNLCVNAVDAMPEQGTLTLRTRNVDDDWIEVSVEDTGAGMTKEVLEKAIDPFFTTKEVGKGTGLGLSMVFSTVKAHQGQMDIQSEPGRGTQVRMRFPVLHSDHPAVEPAAEARRTTAPRELTLLLVDDDELVQYALQDMLRTLGHAVASASSGEEAIAMVDAGFEPDLVILDVNMPGLGGAETLPRLRALQPDLPILLATGRVDQAALDLVQTLPGVSLLAKPIALKDLQQHLNRV